ncbi:hypothetical protein PI95_015270 [Hassallia byssoidea VB512170]|uniref:Trimeric autotransporter adhesin YadA-like head domain-containing protein n=1 Tax=Hassallia byssoidea VB512170 TaxID=1304833 RepID=A0A846HBD7_9CYAN|nr:hypothetical protein [Hassalia byssoidea VB512170]
MVAVFHKNRRYIYTTVLRDANFSQDSDKVEHLINAIAFLNWAIIPCNAIASGDNAIASGDNAIASGDNAIASGDNAIASSDNAIASGDNAIASGDNAIASGDNAIASTCI